MFENWEHNNPCLPVGNHIAADVSAARTVIGSDVTRLVNFFRGAGEIEYCPDWEPAWHDMSELPEKAPVGWPGRKESVISSEQDS